MSCHTYDSTLFDEEDASAACEPASLFDSVDFRKPLTAQLDCLAVDAGSMLHCMCILRYCVILPLVLLVLLADGGLSALCCRAVCEACCFKVGGCHPANRARRRACLLAGLEYIWLECLSYVSSMVWPSRLHAAVWGAAVWLVYTILQPVCHKLTLKAGLTAGLALCMPCLQGTCCADVLPAQLSYLVFISQKK
jgi:hypothetical protein